MTTGVLYLIAILVGASLSGTIVYFSLKNYKSPATIETEIKKTIYMLFLFAEKQGWDGKNKMSYVSHKIYDFIPGKQLADILAGEHLTTYLQEVYEEFRNKLQ